MQAFARYSLLLACLLAAATVAPLRAEEAQEEVEPMSEKTAYEILGVNKRTSDKEIKRIFKEKSLVSPGRPSADLSHARTCADTRAPIPRLPLSLSLSLLFPLFAAATKRSFTRTRRREARRPSRNSGSPMRP